MKRSAPQICASKKKAIECNVCYEPRHGKHCRKCNKHICRGCLKKWKTQCYHDHKKANCPCCRAVWEPPNFYIQAPGGQYRHNFVGIYAGTPYELRPVHKDNKVLGFAVLAPHLMRAAPTEEDMHFDNLEKLEDIAADIKWLIKDLTQGIALITTDLSKEHLTNKFKEAKVHIEHICNMDGQDFYGSIEFEDFITAAQIQDINLF